MLYKSRLVPISNRAPIILKFVGFTPDKFVDTTMTRPRTCSTKPFPNNHLSVTLYFYVIHSALVTVYLILHC